MLRGRPARIVLAVALLATVAVADAVLYTVTRLGLIARCGETCAGEFDPIGSLGVSVILLVLAAGLVVRPRLFRLPTAVLGAALATTWISPITSEHNPELSDVVALGLLGAVPFLLVPPIGRGASSWARVAWIGAIAVAVLFLLLDLVLSGMFGGPLPPQLGLLPFVAALILSGILAARLRRSETHEASLVVPA